MTARKFGRGLFRLLCLLVCTLLLSTQTLAVGGGTGSLTLNYSRNGVEFRIFQVADLIGTYTAAFDGCGVTLPTGDSSNAQRQTAAQELAAYAAKKPVSPAAIRVTAGGQAVFSGLEDGLYLVTGESYTIGNTVYTPIPFLVEVDGEATANGKTDSTTPGTEPEDPKDPEPEEPDEPGPGPDEPKPGPDEPGPSPDQPTPGGDDPGGDQPGGDQPGTSDEPGDEPLPQTGQLWWPVLALASCGGGLMAAGLLRRRDKDHEA